MKHYKYCLLFILTAMFFCGCRHSDTPETSFATLEMLHNTQVSGKPLTLEQCLQYPQAKRRKVITEYFQFGAAGEKVKILRKAVQEVKSPDAKKELQFQLFRAIGECATKQIELCDAMGIYAAPVQVEFTIPPALEALSFPSIEFMEKCVLLTHRPHRGKEISCLNKFRSDYIKLLTAREIAELSFQGSGKMEEKIRQMEAYARYQIQLNIIYGWLGIKNLDSKEIKKQQEKIFVTEQRGGFKKAFECQK